LPSHSVGPLFDHRVDDGPKLVQRQPAAEFLSVYDDRRRRTDFESFLTVDPLFEDRVGDILFL